MTNNHFDVRKAKKFDNEERIRELRPGHLLMDIIGIKPGMVCIDIGSGTGTFSIPMSKLVGTRGIVYAVDDSQIMLGHMQKRNPPTNLKAIHTSAYNTGLSSNIADFCLLSFILHEVKEPDTLLKETFRLLKTGGGICIIEWKAKQTEHGPPQSIRITKERLETLFKQTGFSNFKYVDWTHSHYLAIGKK